MPWADRTRYSAWTGSLAGNVPSPEALLNALGDDFLSEGVDSTLNRTLHQGVSSEELGDLAGIDGLLSQVRGEAQREIDELMDGLDEPALDQPSPSSGDDQLQRVLNALRARAPVVPRLIADAGDELRAALEGALTSAAPGEQQVTIPERLDRIASLARLEQQIRSVRSVADVQDIRPEDIARLLGERAAQRFTSLAEGLSGLVESGYIVREGSQSSLSARAVQRIGDALLQATLQRIATRMTGDHDRANAPPSHELTGTSRQYEPGDDLDLDIGRSVLSAIVRQPGTPVKIDLRDFMVHERESSERATTVLAIDLSRSMGERGYLLAARKLAIVLSTYIRRRFPRDELLVIGFSERARPVPIRDVASLEWDRYGYGTNVHDALRLAGDLLNSHRGTRRNVILITDGEPTAHRNPGGEVVFNHPPAPETLALTYREAERLHRDGVYLLLCLLAERGNVTTFGQHLARHARGDVIVTDPEELGADVMVRYNRGVR